MSKHKSIPKKTRERMYAKYGGHCAYCGCNLPYKEMQVDHIKAVYSHTDYKQDMTEEEMYAEENLLPSCRQCNFYKSTFSLETFRERLVTVLMNGLRKQFTYKLALKYGLIEEHVSPPVFYFEYLQKQQHVHDK